MTQQNISIVYPSYFNVIAEHNSSFDRGILRVCYVGQNRNNSFISKETFERCMQSIYNCPIVCSYDRETNEIGAHDMDIVKDCDDNIVLINTTTPVGVIPESSHYFWKEVEEDDGCIHEYLCIDVLLWKRQEAYKKIKEDGITDESMEISIKEGYIKDGVYVIERFEFNAFCLLGRAEPCYESASLTVFSQDTFKAQLDEMMGDFKKSFSVVQPSQEVVINLQDHLKGGEKILEKKKALLTQYGMSEDMLDFKLDDFSIEELTEKLETTKAQQNDDDGQNADENFALAEQFKDSLIRALSVEKVDTCFGEMNRYWYMDYDSEATEVYCYDNDDWILYGFRYCMNGDNVIVDFCSKKRKKCAVIDFDEGEYQCAFATVYSMVSKQFTENEEKWRSEFQTASEKITLMETEVDGLRKFKEDTSKGLTDQKRELLFAQFEDLVGVFGFEDLREKCEEFTLEQIEEKCYALRGRNQTANFALQEPKVPKLPVEKTKSTNTEPYGGVFPEYGIEQNS